MEVEFHAVGSESLDWIVKSDLLLIEFDTELSLDCFADVCRSDCSVESDAVCAELCFDLNGLTVDLCLEGFCFCLLSSGLLEESSVSLFEGVHLGFVSHDCESTWEQVISSKAVCDGYDGASLSDFWHGLIQDYLHLLKSSPAWFPFTGSAHNAKPDHG